MLKDVLLTGAHNPTQASVLNTITECPAANCFLQQGTTAVEGPFNLLQSQLGLAAWFGGCRALVTLRCTARAHGALLTGMALITPL